MGVLCEEPDSRFNPCIKSTLMTVALKSFGEEIQSAKGQKSGHGPTILWSAFSKLRANVSMLQCFKIKTFHQKYHGTDDF